MSAECLHPLEAEVPEDRRRARDEFKAAGQDANPGRKVREKC